MIYVYNNIKIYTYIFRHLKIKKMSDEIKSQLINLYVNIRSQILKYNNSTSNTSSSNEQFKKELEKLKNSPPESETKIDINPGDWVSINRNYVKDHGDSLLKGNYKILKKTVLAKHLYTNGDSIHEYGYHPD